MRGGRAAHAGFRLWIVGAYVLAAAAAFGAAVADIAYAAVIRSSAVDVGVAATIFACSADALLLADAGTLLLGFAAVAAAWPWPAARLLLVVAVAVCLSGPIAAVVAALLAGPGAAALDAYGPWLRLFVFGAPPALALVAFVRLAGP